MNMKKQTLFLCSVLLLFTLILLTMFDVRGNNHPVHTYVFDVTYVNGDRRTIVKRLPSNFTWDIYSSKGGYDLSIWIPGRNIWGKESVTGEWDYIAGILYVNSITKK